MKVIPRLDVSCLYKQTRQASAILPVQNSDAIRAQSRKLDVDDDKTKTSAFYTVISVIVLPTLPSSSSAVLLMSLTAPFPRCLQNVINIQQLSSIFSFRKTR